MAAYYNEIEPYAAEWLRNLILCELIADGDVDTRSIEDVRPVDLAGYTQCHFFAGIGVWSWALRWAGWPDTRPVWTGSCPCQPFSSAGQGRGLGDERHLWPAWFHLISECRPAVLLGEQVASKDAGPWVDLVHTDLEAVGYAFGAVPFPAAGVGAPHIRDRLYWAALANAAGRGCGVVGGEALPRRGGHADGGESTFWSGADWTPCRDGKHRPVESRVAEMAPRLACDLGYVRTEDGAWQLSPLVEKGQTWGRTGRLRGYGNAICAPAAIEWIKCVMECMPCERKTT